MLILVFKICINTSVGQDSLTTKKNWYISGYHKSLQGLFQIKDPRFGIDEVISDAFLHTRLNFKWFPSHKWAIKADLRNRFFYGELSRSNLFSNFKENLELSNDVLNLEILSIGNDVILHSMIDRLYGEYTSGDWEIKLGRQRINWGINTVWNPHDIFNAFSFTDFDYEERPGSDAIRIKKYTGFASSIEVAFKAFDNKDEIVGGLLWKFNKSNYDFQLLTGWALQDIVLGAGWAGALGDIGFKGEVSYFVSTDDTVDDVFAGTLSLDYVSGNGTFYNIGLLYNSSSNDHSNLFAFNLSARNLYPYRWSTFLSVSQPFTPLFTGSMALIYSPVSGHPLFINPTLTYSLAQNLDVSFIGQIFLEGITTGDYRSPTKVAYMRLKMSF